MIICLQSAESNTGTGIENKIEVLLKTRIDANATWLNYANHMIEKLGGRKQPLLLDVANMTAKAISPDKIGRISDNLDDWESTDFEERRLCSTIKRLGSFLWKSSFGRATLFLGFESRLLVYERDATMLEVVIDVIEGFVSEPIERIVNRFSKKRGKPK